jgi:cobalt-zinc-cadmium efflux system membrane fusion protein
MTRFFFCLCAMLLMAACKEAPHETAAGNPKVDAETIVFPADSKQAATLGLAKVQAGAPVPVTLTGRLVWNEERSARLYPAFAGKVVKILLKPGDKVKAGQTLALLASPDFGQAQSDASRTSADYALAEKSVARARALHEHGVIAQKELDAAEADHRKAELELRRTSNRLKLYGNGDGVAQRFALTSPISGIVVERNINPGQELRPDLISANVPAMFVVTDPARLWVQLDAGEKDLPYVRKRMTVPLRSASFPGEVFPAKIEAVSDSVDPITRTVKVRGTVDNAQRKLKSEMFITATVPRAMDGAVQVPADAVYLRGARHFVFVESGAGRFMRREITVGPAQETSIAVLSGLREGETVVAQGNLLLQQLLSESPVK